MMTKGRINPYCEALGIAVPRLEVARESRDANTYSLLIAALLERGEPITLPEAARRFEEAGIASAERALVALKRCRPARPPIYRDGDHYALDPYDDQTSLWAFRLGLKPPKVPRLQIVRPDPGPLPSPDQPLTVAHLDEAWRHGIPSGWSALRIAICLLDAHGGAMPAERVLAFERRRSRWPILTADSARYWRKGAAIRTREDGVWELDRSHAAVRSARKAAQERVAAVRQRVHPEPDPAVVAANMKRLERQREAHAESLARLRRALIHAFPARKPEVAVLLDVGRREIATFPAEEYPRLRKELAGYDLIAGVDVRTLLRRLDFDPGQRRLGELGPPQKTRRLNRRGRTLRITTRLLIQGSCGISRPLGDEVVLQRYLQNREHTRLRRRLEADAKSLFALYQYGRLHGVVRLRWGFLDEMIPAPWVHPDETTLYDLMKRVHGRGEPLEVVVGSAPGWTDPWSRARRVYVQGDERGWRLWLIDEWGHTIDRADVQLARLIGEAGA